MKAVTVAFVFSVAIIAQTKSSNADFRVDLAKRLNIVDSQYLILNLPPRPSCFPGTVFSSDLRTNIRPISASGRGFERGPEFSFTTAIDIDGSSGLDVSGAVLPFALAAEEKASYSANLTISKAHVLEIAGPGIKGVIAKLPRSIRRSMPAPALVQRAYEGMFTLKLTGKAGLSASAKRTFFKKAVDAGAKVKVDASGDIAFESPEPVVFAFEVARITDFDQLIKAAQKLENENTAFGEGKADRASKDVIMSADVPRESPSMTGGTTGATATVGATEVREHLERRTAGSETGYVRVPAVEFESVNVTPRLTVR